MSSNIVWHNTHITKKQRAKQKNQKACILWFSGLSGSGKSTIANGVEQKLFEMNYHTYLLDGDNVRHGLNNDLGFDDKSREENIRRVAEVAKLFVDSGLIVLSSFISPFQKDRDFVRSIVEDGEFIEIFIDAPLEVCESRDPKGLYKKARDGEIKNFTGISSPYEKPKNCEIYLDNYKYSIDININKVIAYLETVGYIRKKI